MAKTATPALIQNPKLGVVSFTNADAINTKKTVYTAGTNDSKLVQLNATSTDSVSHVVNIYLTRGGVSYLLGSATIAALAGSDGATPTQNLLATLLPLPTDNDGQKYILLNNGDTIQVSFPVIVTSAKEVDVYGIGADF